MSMKCNFVVGQRVRCVKDALRGGRGLETLPENGKVYTVRAVFPYGPSIWLEEIVNKPALYRDGFVETSFHVEGFRPVVDRKTDITVFRDMLTPKKESVPA